MSITLFLSPFPLPLADFGDALPMVGWIITGIIVVVGLGVFGRSEIFRFSPSRIWAIGGVCFRESIRRRVLWIIPLAIVGVVIVSQLERAFDEQDIIRQTTKFCLFATGLVVTMVCIILAGTNLPKEIDNRVIYTIVTKPTTRLELVLGKTVGFARVSAIILLIMGLFSYAYLRARTWSQEQEVASRLSTDLDLDPAEQNKLEHYHQTGLLTARAYAAPMGVEVMGPLPPEALADLGPDPSAVRSIFGDNEQEFLFPIRIDRQRLFGASDGDSAAASAGGIGENGLLIAVRLKWQRYGPQTSEVSANAPPVGPAGISIDVLDANGYSLVNASSTYDPKFPQAKDAHTSFVELTPENPATPIPEKAGPVIQSKWVWSYIPASQAASFYDQPLIYVHVTGPSHNVQYFADGQSVFVTTTTAPEHGAYAPTIPPSVPDNQRIGCAPGQDGHPSPPVVRGRLSTRGGQELVGRALSDPHTPVAVFHFHRPPITDASGTGYVSMEMRVAVEHGGDAADEHDATTDLTVSARPDDGGAASAPIDLKLENKQLAYAQLPISAVGSGNFDVLVRCNSPDHVLGVETASLGLVTSQDSFLWNLAKSLVIMWMLTVLVVVLAIFSSTFLSWPIAVVLTAVLLMGHWAVTQVADSADTSLGRSIATDMGLTDPNKAEAVATSVNALTSVLQVVGAALPDIDRFAAIQLLENGKVVGPSDMIDGLGVLVGFGLPAAVLAFVLLKYKEVAP